MSCTKTLMAIAAILLTSSAMSQAKKLGYVDENGKIVIEPKYDVAKNFHDGLAVVKLGDNVGCINKKGEVVIPFEYQFIGDFSQGLAHIYKNKKFGYVNTNGQLVIQYNYDYAFPMNSEGYTYVQKDRSKPSWGIIDKTGKEIFPCAFEWLIYNNKASLIPVKLNGNWGFADKSGKVVIACKYDTVRSFYNNGFAEFTYRGKKGLLNTMGKEVLPAKFGLFTTSSTNQKTGLWAIDGDDCYYITPTAEAIYVGKRTDFNDFEEGFSKVYVNVNQNILGETDDGVYFINFSGKRTIPSDWRNRKFKGATDFKEGRAAVWETEDSDGDPQWYFIDTFGNKINNNTYKKIHDFQNGVACVSNKRVKPGNVYDAFTDFFVINKNGQQINSDRYSSSVWFTEKIASAEKNGKWGFIDNNGRTVVPFVYQETGYFHHGLAYIKENNKYGFVNVDGKIVVPPKYADKALTQPKTGYLVVAKENSKKEHKLAWGIIDSTGKEVTAFKYDKIETIMFPGIQKGFFEVEIDHHFGCVNVRGKEVVPPSFSFVWYDENTNLLKTQCEDNSEVKRTGYYTPEGNEIAGCQFVRVYDFKQGIALAVDDKKQIWAIKRNGGSVALPKGYSYYDFSEGMAAMIKD